jgi:hypothetical protein
VEIFYINKKALQQKTKGLGSQGSPYWIGSELFVQVMKLKKIFPH